MDALFIAALFGFLIIFLVVGILIGISITIIRIGNKILNLIARLFSVFK